MHAPVWHRYAWANRLQTALLMRVLPSISGLAGKTGRWLALAAGAVALLFEPAAASHLTLHLYRARPIQPAEAPELWHLPRQIAERAELPAMPTPYYVPSPVSNAFAVGSREHSAIALTDGLLHHLSPRAATRSTRVHGPRAAKRPARFEAGGPARAGRCYPAAVGSRPSGQSASRSRASVARPA